MPDQDDVLVLEPMPEDPDHVPGQYASVDVSPEPIFGPVQLGAYKSAIDDLTSIVTKADSSARLFEVLQAWEARLFSRGFQFLLSAKNGWGLYGGRGTATPASIVSANNARKLFPVNVYGAREDKITAALSREVPGLVFTPKDPDSPPDQTAADEADNYLQVWLLDSDLKGVVAKMAKRFYNESRSVNWTRSVADQQRWGTEVPDQDAGFGDDAEGETPETENQPDPKSEGAGGDGGETSAALEPTAIAAPGSDTFEPYGPKEQPAICELTTNFGVLESKVPLYVDELADMGWVRVQTEVDQNILKERYPWIEDKIEPGGLGDDDQMARTARIHVRLVIQNSSSSGESSQGEATETHTWYRPSQYRAIKDKQARQVFRKNFPNGLRVTHAGKEFAFCRNECVDDHIDIRHAREGDGQSRRSIGANYLPLQKVLNQTIGLLRRYFTACVPRRFAAEGPIDVDALNQQENDPALVTAVKLDEGGTLRIQDVTGIEAVPQPTSGLMEFVKWLIEGAPEAMDGATPTMFGGGDVGTVGESTLNRDQSLQVFSAPWAEICKGLARSATQAVRCAAKNRVTNIRSRTPGQNKLTVELSNLKGDALCAPESLEIPKTLAEQEAQIAALIEQSANVEVYKAIVEDPNNLPYFSRLPSLSGLNLPGLDSVEKQQGEFELMMEAPVPNPEIAQMQETLAKLKAQMQQGATHPEAQTPQGQALMQQLPAAIAQVQQQIQSLPPLVSTVEVAQDGSENHAIEAAVVLHRMNSAEGRKLKNGSEDQKAIYQNWTLHWQAHEAMAAKLTPVQPLPAKASVTVAIDKLPPNVQAQALTALGVAAKPEDFQNTDELVPHEVTVEKEGVDANGVPVKQKISTVNPGGKLR